MSFIGKVTAFEVHFCTSDSGCMKANSQVWIRLVLS